MPKINDHQKGGANKEIHRIGPAKLGFGLAFFVAFLLLVFGPLDIFSRVRNIFSEKTTIAFYASVCGQENFSPDYTAGWWNADGVSGEPDLDAAAALEEFNEENSAFYRGGDYALSCAGFYTADQAEEDFQDLPIKKARLKFSLASFFGLAAEDGEGSEEREPIASSSLLQNPEEDNLINTQTSASSPILNEESEEINPEDNFGDSVPEQETEPNLSGADQEQILPDAEDPNAQDQEPEVAEPEEDGQTDEFGPLAAPEADHEAQNEVEVVPLPAGEVLVVPAPPADSSDASLESEPNPPADPLGFGPGWRDLVARPALAGEEPFWEIYYSLGQTGEEREWHLAGAFPKRNSAAGRDDYFALPLSGLDRLADVEQLAVKVRGVYEGEEIFVSYLDSLWVELEYEWEKPVAPVRMKDGNEFLSLLSERLTFRADEGGEMTLAYAKADSGWTEELGRFFGLDNYWRDLDLRARLINPAGEEISLPLTLIFEEDGRFTVQWPPLPDHFQPGRYTLDFTITDNSGGETELLSARQDFSWGVLALNFNKAVYAPGAVAFLQAAVLDAGGHTVCDADLDLEIISPAGQITRLRTAENTAVRNPACGPNNITAEPDYYAHYRVALAGQYEVRATAKTADGEYAISDRFWARPGEQMDVERIGPTRIYPQAEYKMSIRIQAAEDFFGALAEKVPSGFKIIRQSLSLINHSERDPFGPAFGFSVEDAAGQKNLVWSDVEIQAGDELVAEYDFDAPDISPALFQLGPLTVGAWSESRTWQIASDAVNKRARTVMFAAGTYNGGATSGQNTNTDNTLPVFNWRLAESGVSIKNAYVIFESQFEAYNTTGGAYGGYKLGFDVCVESCSASAFGAGAGQVLQDVGNVLVYDDTESNVVRLLLDVTGEAQIAAYAGGGQLMQSQFGYRLKNTSAYTSIASAGAILVITYTYDLDSPDLTNTVIYPLDSTNGTDNGARQAGAGSCTADNGSCPIFEYKMDLPDWPGAATTTNRVSQWFKMFGASDVTGTTDINPYLDIENVNNDSPAFHYESALNNNGFLPTMLFSAWTNDGFAENQTQQIEYFTGSTVATTYALGGEVWETYLASSSAPVKTRTVSFPMGVITNGGVNTLNSAAVNVFFPENGSATGTVGIKSAWLRLSVHGAITSRAYTITVSSKVGENATSSNQVYSYNANGVMANPSTHIIYIIPSDDYAALEEARATSSQPVKANLTYSNANFSGASAELLITYGYASEADGYLASLNIFAGQSAAAPATSTVLATANAVFPEAAGKTVFNAALYGHFLISDSATAMGTGLHYLGANLAVNTPSCATAYIARPDSVNMYTEMIRDVSSALLTTDNQAYNACYANDNTGLATDGASMGGQLIYTYGWQNSPPDSAFISASTTVARDGTGAVGLTLAVSDPDSQPARVKIEFAPGADCDFSAAENILVDEQDASTTAIYGDPDIDNLAVYPIGTSTNYITTASGTNRVAFFWLSQPATDGQEGTYCLRATANDLRLDQSAPATTTVFLDNLAPSAPGALSLHSRTGTSLVLNFGATSTESNFSEYKIFYKIADGSAPTESDLFVSSSTDPRLGNQNFLGAATTSIADLSAKQTYSLALWAYDQYGNRASSSFVDILTNDAPSGAFNGADTKQKTDGSGTVDISLKLDDLNDDNTLRAKIEYVLGADCDFSFSLDPLLDENPASIQADFGSPALDNLAPYQVGSSSAWILTSPGSNTVNVDWLAKEQLVNGSGVYCLRLTANDGLDDQLNLATSTVVIDHINPTSTGALTAESVTTSTITLLFATSTPGADEHPPLADAYKIFYKKGAPGVTESDTEIDLSALDDYDYNGATSTLLAGLDQNSWYYFQIWTYDYYGNKSSSTELAVKTNATVANVSLSFTNSRTEGADANIAIADGLTEWNFRAVVTEQNGWQVLDTVDLRFADSEDSESPFSDLVFRWNQSAGTFAETGPDALGAAALSADSASNCSGLSCTLDFKIIFNQNARATSTPYAAELKTINDSAVDDEDPYNNFYQIRFPWVDQIHYRWRNDDGGE